MAFLTGIGLFVNPSTTWYHYHPAHAVSGLRYYNSKTKITSTTEVQQVNAYLVSVASSLKGVGVVIWVKLIQRKMWWLPEFFVEGPLALCILICITGLTKDLMAIAAIRTLLLDQSIAILTTPLSL